MFNFFNKNKNECTITTKVTKLSTQSDHEKKVRSEAEIKARTCPECGFVDNNRKIGYGFRRENGVQGFHGKCKCGAEWDVTYKI